MKNSKNNYWKLIPFISLLVLPTSGPAFAQGDHHHAQSSGHQEHQEPAHHAEDTQTAHHGEEVQPAKLSDTVLGHYFAIQEALAADSLDGVNANAQSIVQELNHDPLGTRAQSLTATKNLAAAREAFKGLSATLVEGLESGQWHLDSGSAYLIYCPMVKSHWLQAGKAIRNPYYGSSILTCGTIRKKLGQEHTGEGHHSDADMGHHEQQNMGVIPSDARRLKIIAKEFMFAPANVSAHPNETLVIELVNEGVVAHMWEIKGLEGTHVHAEVGETVLGIIRVPSEPGVYETYCTVPGHKEAGMAGKLIVTEDHH